MKNVIIIFISLFIFSCNNKTKEDSVYVVDGESEAICDSMITTILSYMPGFVPIDTAYYLTPDSVMADEDRDGRDMISKVVRTVRGKDTLYIEATSHKHNTISSSNNLRDIKDIRRHNL